MKDRKTGKVSTAVTPKTDKPTLQGFVEPPRTERRSTPTNIRHTTTEPSGRPSLAKEFVNGEPIPTGLSHWAMLKRGNGTYHHVSVKDRYATEFAGRHNNRPSDNLEQIHTLMKGMDG